jgi:hypothetical protein
MAAVTLVQDTEVFTAGAAASMAVVVTTLGDTTVALTSADQELGTAAAGLRWAEVLHRHAVSTELEVRCQAEARVTARL